MVLFLLAVGFVVCCYGTLNGVAVAEQDLIWFQQGQHRAGDLIYLARDIVLLLALIAFACMMLFHFSMILLVFAAA